MNIHIRISSLQILLKTDQLYRVFQLSSIGFSSFININLYDCMKVFELEYQIKLKLDVTIFHIDKLTRHIN